MIAIPNERLRERAREKVMGLELAVTQTAFADSRAELEEELELARIALASLEAEAVCVIDQANLDYLKSDSDADVWPASRIEMGDVLLYRAAMLQGADGNSPVIPDCSCRTCRPVTFSDSRFVVCPECGNKRCPHANDHRNACTGSNEPGQEGSAYPAAPQQEE